MSEDKRKQLQGRVNSKVHWGADDDEVLEWLREEHGLAGAQADRMLDEAHRELRKEVRARAMLGMAGSGIVIIAVIVFVGLQIGSGRYVIGFANIVIPLLGLAAVGFFIRSLSRFLSGRYLTPMDS